MKRTEENDLISIVIPAYNVEEYIERCIKSVCDQSYGNIEAVIVDDGSDDTTLRICEGIAAKDSRIRVISKENKGVSSARNRALDEIRGDMIAFVDADDYMEPDCIKQLYEAMKETEADLVCCAYYEEYPDHTRIMGVNGRQTVYDNYEAYEDYFRMGGRIGTGCWNKLFRADILKDIRYKDYDLGEDVEMLCRALEKCNKVVCIDYLGYHYIHRNDSATQIKFRRKNLDILDVVDEMTEYVKERHPELIKQMYAFKAAWQVATIQVLYKTGNVRAYKTESDHIKRNIQRSLSGYRQNSYLSTKDRIILFSFILGVYFPVQKILDFLSYSKRALRP
ncbi:MAG: glycosyltransferase [Lachnospiraceae bacterium]|nr:glycosyltransferase [Lachnospiraceae bacterium]